jgi:hypothetical protein
MLLVMLAALGVFVVVLVIKVPITFDTHAVSDAAAGAQIKMSGAQQHTRTVAAKRASSAMGSSIVCAVDAEDGASSRPALDVAVDLARVTRGATPDLGD